MKHLIIDKSAFQGTITEKLCEFVENHFLILPEVLIYECATEQNEKQKSILLERFKCAILSGAYTCPSMGMICEKESKQNKPYYYLPDLNETSILRKILKKAKYVSWSNKNIQEICAEEEMRAKLLKKTAENVAKTLKSAIPETVKEANKKLNNNTERFKLWFEAIDKYDIHRAAVEKLPHRTDASENFCTSGEWFTWHWLRLTSVITFEHHFKVSKGGGKKLLGIEHDLQDIMYVMLLCGANGLITNDKELVERITRIAFPEKDVFSSLDEVPDTYKCHWN